MDGLWQVDRLPRVGALRQASARLGGIPAAAAALRIDPDVDPASPTTLLHKSLGVRLVFHPSLSALADAAGATAASLSALSVPAAGPSARPDALRALAAQVSPGAWVVPDGDTHRTATPEEVAALLSVSTQAVGAVPGPARGASRLGPGRVSLTRKGRILTLRLLCDPITVTCSGRAVRVSAQRIARLTPTEAPALVAALSKAALVVVDADTPERLDDLAWVTDRRLLITPTPGAPGWATVDAGPLVTSSMPTTLPAPDAVAGARPARGKVAVAVDPLVEAAGAVAAAAPLPTAVPGVTLRSWQEQFIGRYLATEVGLLNALPPGAGKTACVAGAMAAAARTTPAHRGLAVVPVTVIDQWTRELATFHPDARVVTAATDEDLTRLEAVWAHPGHVVGLTSPALVGRHSDRFAALRIDDLAVDEGTYLRGQSAQTRALWQLRTAGPRTVVLTGTPDSGLAGTVEALVAFVLGRPDAFETGTRDPALVGLSPLERAGVWTFGGSDDVAAALPRTKAHVRDLKPGPGETAVQSVAVDRVRAVLATATTTTALRKAAPKLKVELDGWRTGLACPAALLTGTSALARAVAADLGEPSLAGANVASIVAEAPHLAGAKVAWASAWAAKGTADGQQSLVFADSVPALEVLAAHLTSTNPQVRTGVLTGKVRPAARARLVEEFVGGGLDVLLVAATGQLGLNLQVASRVAHLDVPATAASFTQRSARAARMGAAHTSIDVAVPLLTGSADPVWWSRAAGKRAATDVLGLAGELVGSKVAR